MRSYKESMNQIVMTDALKERIRRQAADSRKAVRPVRRRYMVCANIAACLLLLLCTQMRLSDFLIPTQNISLPMSSATAVLQATTGDTALPAQTPAAKEISSYHTTRETEIPKEPHGASRMETYAEPVISEEQNDGQTETAKKQAVSGTPLRTEKPSEDQLTKEETPAAPDAADPKKDMTEPVLGTPPQAKPPLTQGAPSAGGGGGRPSGGGGGGGVNSSGVTEWGETTGGIQQFDSLETLRAQCGFPFQIPAALPKGCTLRGVELLSGNLVQLTYDGSPAFLFRAAAGEGDVSGGHHEYDEMTTQTVRNVSVSLRGNAGLVYTAAWQENGVCYAILTDGISQEQMLQLITAMS